MSTVLETVAVAADDVADDQRSVARRARAMQCQRDRGWSWVRVLDREAEPGLLGLLREAQGDWPSRRTTWPKPARGLAGEGQSRRQIARRRGVTHQRITAMLRQDRRSEDGKDTVGDR